MYSHVDSNPLCAGLPAAASMGGGGVDAFVQTTSTYATSSKFS